jgi:hypothetical protein
MCRLHKPGRKLCGSLDSVRDVADRDLSTKEDHQ